MRFTILLFFCFFSFQGATAVAQEADTDFNVRVFGGSDTEVPTTPVLSATATTPTQIDLTWSTSTDNFFLSGYRLFRDGSVIATTSLLSYTDTGLTSSSSYSYRVQAFDSSFNYSSSSNTATVTTPEITVSEEPQAEFREATAARTVLDDLVMDLGISTTSVSLKTAFPSRVELRWGRTKDYELGYFVGGIYRRDHNFLLTDLEPGTTYMFEIVGYTPRGNETVLLRDSFTTNVIERPDIVPNVRNFTATAQGDDVILSWILPSEVETNYVRVVRSHLGYPQFPTDGAIVYQGLSNGVTEGGILRTYSPVYYTAFLYDREGNVSSGAIAVVYENGDADSDTLNRDAGEESGIEAVNEAIFEIDSDRLAPGMKMPLPEEIGVLQGSFSFTMQQAPLRFNNTDEIIVSIPIETISGNLKSIIVKMTDPSDNRVVSSYLLRINRNRTAYEAVLPNPELVGESQLQLEIYDFESYVVAKYQTPVTFSVLGSGDSFWSAFVRDQFNLILLGILLAAAVFLVFLLVRRLGGMRITPNEVSRDRGYS